MYIYIKRFKAYNLIYQYVKWSCNLIFYKLLLQFKMKSFKKLNFLKNSFFKFNKKSYSILKGNI